MKMRDYHNNESWTDAGKMAMLDRTCKSPQRHCCLIEEVKEIANHRPKKQVDMPLYATHKSGQIAGLQRARAVYGQQNISVDGFSAEEKEIRRGTSAVEYDTHSYE